MIFLQNIRVRLLKLIFVFLHRVRLNTSTSAAQHRRPAASESCGIATHKQTNVCDTDVRLMDNMGQLLTLCRGNPGLLSSPSPSDLSLFPFCPYLLFLSPAGQAGPQFVQLRQIREEKMREARRRVGEKPCGGGEVPDLWL